MKVYIHKFIKIVFAIAIGILILMILGGNEIFGSVSMKIFGTPEYGILLNDTLLIIVLCGPIIFVLSYIFIGLRDHRILKWVIRPVCVVGIIFFTFVIIVIVIGNVYDYYSGKIIVIESEIKSIKEIERKIGRGMEKHYKVKLDNGEHFEFKEYFYDSIKPSDVNKKIWIKYINKNFIINAKVIE